MRLFVQIRGEVFRSHDSAAAHDAGILDRIAEKPDVSRPIIFEADLEGFRAERAPGGSAVAAERA